MYVPVKESSKDEMQNTSNLLFLMIHFAVCCLVGAGAGGGGPAEE